MSRKKKTEIKYYKVLTHTCRRCGFEGEELFEDFEAVPLENKRCPRCHTHMPFPQVTHIEEEI